MGDFNWSAVFYYFSIVVDIVVVAFGVYKLSTYIINTKAINILKGIIGIALFFFFASFFRLKTILWLFEKSFEIFPLALVILFQDEIKRILTTIGGTPRIFTRFGEDLKNSPHSDRDKIIAAMQLLSQRKIGALILLQQRDELMSIKEKSVILNAWISEPLLVSIFIPTTPLHDGAVIIKNNLILTARGFLPITEEKTAPYLGSRHRAAIGITENTDTIALVVSEETGYLSLAYKGKIFYNLGIQKLKEKISEILDKK
ncbi:MAG: TIGR00159 family protein [Spirochaetes bacterium GWB1_36_13]|nr:MAG: TIGR00159 family protein [Spirochaetes bacterium GWB1_36_13]